MLVELPCKRRELVLERVQSNYCPVDLEHLLKVRLPPEVDFPLKLVGKLAA